MDSPTDLFDDSAPQIHSFAPALNSSDLPGVHPQAGRPPPAFRPPGFPLIHHLLQPGGGHRRMGGLLNPNLSSHRHLEDRNFEEDKGERDGQVEQGMEGGEEGGMEGEDNLLGVKKRHSDAALTAEWSQDVLKVKRMKLEGRQRDGEAEEGGKRREGGRAGRRREREELKEQLEEARERLQALQEKVWRAFGEKHMAEEEKKRKHGNRNSGGGDGDVGMLEEEDITEGMYDEEDIDGGEMEKESFSLLSASPFDNFHKRKEDKDREGKVERGRGGGGGGGGGLHFEGLMEGSGLWLDCGGLVRGDWEGGMEDEGEEGGQKFAQALKLELGSAVARVIDRVLRLYTEMTDFTPSSPPAAISFLSSDTRKAYPLLGPPLSTHLNPSHPNLTLHHPSLPRPPPLSHPPLLPPASQPKDPSSSSSFHPSSSSSSSSSSSFPAPPPPPPPPPPLPLPLLHYSMQQLFSRSLHHHQLPHLPPSRKDYLNSDPFLDHLFATLLTTHTPFPFLIKIIFLLMILATSGKIYILYVAYTDSLFTCSLPLLLSIVQFNRCVTSQMIKWFSNFREFFYIQMERFARQAVREALTRWLRVGRDTELYRILNMHYNKSNVYQVPERFIEVSEVALREFYSAIWTGRDSDPCWKKGIYKIICKLDSPLPDAFRLPGCPVG
uniref:Prospero domain-containing protein n=1 Tax=Amphiprion ocellaris TaxID=80972 RepID=A0AAQ6A3T5_AMPOC